MSTEISEKVQPPAAVKITVITVVKNGRDFIADTIESVVGQSHGDLEYIVIDGGSTDGTVEIIKAYEARIAKWVSEPDGGIADAFNKGLANASGDYILMLNSDDALAGPGVLDAMVGELARHNFPAMIYGDYDIIDRESGGFLYRGSVQLTREGLLRGQVLPHPCLLARRSYFEQYGNFDVTFRIAMDYEWLLRGAFSERIVHVSSLVSRIRDGGLSTRDRNRVVDEIIRALKKNGHLASGVAVARMRLYFFSRAFVRKVLETVGLYSVFFAVRNRLRNG